MFKNSGPKIQELAVCIFVLEMFVSIGFGLAFSIENESIFSFFLIVFFGLLISWISTISLHGLGEMIENSQIIKDEAQKQTELLRVILKNNSPADTDSNENKLTNSNQRIIQNWLDGNIELK